MGARRAAPIVPVPQKVTSRKHARRVVTQYHEITKRIHDASSAADAARAAADLESIGGVEAYQQASALSTLLHSTSRWVLRQLRARALCPPACSAPRLLEIGAVNTQLLDSADVVTRAIDLCAAPPPSPPPAAPCARGEPTVLTQSHPIAPAPRSHSSHPRIEARDFFTLSHGGDDGDDGGGDSGGVATALGTPYDVVVCAMVLNCVPTPRGRFEMLRGIRAQLRSGGLAFIVIPRTCVLHSRTLTEALFIDCLAAVGLKLIDTDAATSGPSAAAGEASASPAKLVFYVCEAFVPDADAARRFQRGRHERRDAWRLKQRRLGGGAKAKSRGALFDVDLGGYLGIGVSVPRSYEPTEGHTSRAQREQARAREAFLRRLGSGGLAGSGEGGGGGVGGDANDGEADAAGDAAGADVPGAALSTAEASRRIAAQVSRHPPERLDYARWEWRASWHAASAAPRGWAFRAPAAPAATDSMARLAGWQWSARGWERRPRPAAAPAGTRLPGVRHARLPGPWWRSRVGYGLSARCWWRVAPPRNWLARA